MRRTRAGFTLLEMLVAIAIFASLALMAQQVTNGVTRVNSAVADHDQKLNLMQQTMSFLTHDLTQMIPRPVRGDQGQREPALLAGAGVLASESEGMRFVRGGVVNPLMRLPRSNLLTVGYRIHDGYLERLAWPLTDAAGSVKPTMQKLIPADSLRLQFYDGTRWQESWSSVQAIPVEQALWARRPSGTIHHSDKGSQYVSLAYTQRLKEAGLLASTGSTGDSYDNAMAESIHGLYKAEVIHRKSWKNRTEVELGTLTWVDWYNNRRLLERLGHTPPAEAEKAYYASIGNNDLEA